MLLWIRPVAVILLVTAVLFLPYLLRGDRVHVPEADNMDSNIAWYKMLVDQDKVWAAPTVKVQGMVGETPRFSYPSGLNIEVLLYTCLEPVWAYAVNKLLIYLIAFFSMFYLLKGWCRHEDMEMVMLVALVWATLSFYPHRGISIAGMPMVAWSILNLWQAKHKQWAYGGLMLYAGYSMLVLAGFFVWFSALVLVMILSVYSRQWPKHVFFGLIFWILAYLILDYQLVYGFFMAEDFVSHRSVVKYTGADFSFLHIIKLLSQGNYLGAYHWWGYLPIVMVMFFIRRKNARHQDTIIGSLLMASILVVLATLLNMPFMVNIMGQVWSSLHSFSLVKIGHLAPFFLFFPFGILFLEAKTPYKKAILVGLIGLNIFPYQYEWRNMVNEHFPFLGYRSATFREFYAEDLYDELKTYLEKSDPKYIGHINIHPAVSAYNGLSCIDGYVQNYSLFHKEKIIDVIAEEIQGNAFLEYHIKEWGNKCYLQHTTYPDVFNAYKWKEAAPVLSLDYDFVTLKERLKVDYLISALPIATSHLQLEKTFQHPDAAWDIYLYAIR